MTPMDQRTRTVKINFHTLGRRFSDLRQCQDPLQVFSSSLLMKTSCLRLKLVELNFLVSFNTDDQSKTDVTYTVNVTTYKSKSSRCFQSMNEEFGSRLCFYTQQR